MQYYYRIKHKTTGRTYVGSQYGKRSDPSLFFVKYFTSSRQVQQLVMEDGKDAFEIIKVVPLNDARRFESRVLQYCYRKLGKDLFMHLFYNRNTAPGILLDDCTRARLVADPIKNAKIASTVSGNTNVRGKSWWNDGERMKRSVECPGEGWVKGALRHSEETKQKRSNSLKGITRSDITKQKMADARNRPDHNGSHKGTTWITYDSGNRKRVKKEMYES